MYQYEARLLRLIDGDTFVLDIDLGFWVHTHQHIRLEGIDCPEANTAGGRAASAFARAWWASRNDQAFILTTPAQPKTFDRWVARVSAPYGQPLVGDHANLADALRLNGHFKPVEQLG